MLKALLVLEIFTFLFELFGYIGKWLDNETRLISKFMTSQTGLQIVTYFAQYLKK